MTFLEQLGITFLILSITTLTIFWIFVIGGIFAKKDLRNEQPKAPKRADLSNTQGSGINKKRTAKQHRAALRSLR